MTGRSVLVTLRAKVSDYNRAMVSAGVATKAFVKDLESSNDRMSMIVQSSLALGPALVPLGAAVVPAIAGLTAALGFAAVGAGATALAFGGVGDALKALNDYELEPTDAHLRKLNETMGALGPAGRDFAMTLQELRPELQKLQDTAQEGMLPGVTEGINDLMTRMPEVQGILESVSTQLGNLAADAGGNLASPRFNDFFTYLQDEAGPALDAMGNSIGLIVEGLGNMVMAFDPLNDDFFNGLVSVSTAFRDWSANLGESDGFQHFIDYVEQVGPQVWQTLGAIATALIDIVQAAAPIGQGVLVGLEVLANAFSAIAGSPVGPVLLGAAAGMAAISRAVALYSLINGAAMTKLLGNLKAFKLGGTVVPSLNQFGTVMYRAGQSAEHTSVATTEARTAVRGFASSVGPAVVALGGLALASTGVADKVGLQNTVMFASIGLMAGPYGAALGAAAGATVDLAKANDGLEESIRNAYEAARDGTLSEQRAALEDLRAKTEEYDTTFQNAFGLHGDASIANSLSGLAQLGGAMVGLGDDAKDALEYLSLELHDSRIGAGDLSDVLGDSLSPSLGITKDAFERAAIGADAYRDSLEGINAFLDKRAAFRQYQAALDDAGENLQKRADIQRQINELEADGAAEREKIRRDASEGGTDAGGDLAQLQRKLGEAHADAANGKTASARQNANQRVLDIEKQIADLRTRRGRDAVDTNDKVTESYKRQQEQIADLKEQLADLAPNARTGNRGGRANQENLDDIARQAINAAGFMTDGKRRNQFLADARKEYIQRAKTFGVDPEKARADASKSGLLAITEKPPSLDVNIAPAREKIGELETRIKKFQRKYHVDILLGNTDALARLEELRLKLVKVKHLANVQVHVDTRLGPIGSAAGNVFSGGGDVANGHLPAVYGAAGPARVFKEPETKGESYIPHANDWRRPRALSIWEETGRILGVQFRHFAAGDVVHASRPAPSYITGAGMDYARLARAMTAARPLYGDVLMQPHDYNQFRREMDADRRAAAGGSESFT